MPPVAARAGDLAFIQSGDCPPSWPAGTCLGTVPWRGLPGRVWGQSPGVACRDVSGDCPPTWLAGTCLGTVPRIRGSSGRVRAAPVRLRLRAVAADLHRAPGRRAVLRVVVERPAALVVAAALEAAPGPVGHGREADDEHPSDHAVDPAGASGRGPGRRSRSSASPRRPRHRARAAGRLTTAWPLFA